MPSSIEWDPLIPDRGLSLCGGGIEERYKTLMYEWKLFYLLALVQIKGLPQREYFWHLFLASQYFHKYEIIESIVPDFSVYFDENFFLIAKINP